MKKISHLPGDPSLERGSTLTHIVLQSCKGGPALPTVISLAPVCSNTSSAQVKTEAQGWENEDKDRGLSSQIDGARVDCCPAGLDLWRCTIGTPCHDRITPTQGLLRRLYVTQMH